MKIKTASVQFNHAPADKAYNLAIIHDFCVKASEQKVELIVSPEMCITGYWLVRNLKQAACAAPDMNLPHKCIGRRWITSRRPELYEMLSQPTGKEQDVKIVRFE